MSSEASRVKSFWVNKVLELKLGIRDTWSLMCSKDTCLWLKDAVNVVTLPLTFKWDLNLELNLMLWTFQPRVIDFPPTAACLGSSRCPESADALPQFFLRGNTFSETIVQKDKYSQCCQGIGGTASFSESRNFIALKFCKWELSSWVGFSLGRRWSVFEMFSTVSGKSHSPFGQYVKY